MKILRNPKSIQFFFDALLKLCNQFYIYNNKTQNVEYFKIKVLQQKINQAKYNTIVAIKYPF